MDNRYLYHFNWAFGLLFLTFSIVGCSGRLDQSSPQASKVVAPTAELISTNIPTEVPTEEARISPTATSAPVKESIVNTGVRYEDDYTDESSGWPKEEFDNYFIGYHEPDYYHIDVRSPNDKELVPVPNKESYGDITVEAQVLTDQNNTAASGDFLYGLAFRRSGDQYYAFTISPRSGKWFVLKSSPDRLEVLKEGSDDTIQGLEALDRLQVDVKGTTFYFHINDQLVDQVSDSDYAEGEVGLFVQTLDTQRAHVHFDSLIIREVDAPLQACKVTSFGIRIRRGPSTSFNPAGFLERGDDIEVQGRNLSGNWIQIRVKESDQVGWIFNDPDWITCNFLTADLPITEP